MKKISSKFLFITLAILLLVQSAPVSATYPGSSGKILFRTYEQSGWGEVNTINPNGTGRVQLDIEAGSMLTYSPTGNYILKAKDGVLVLHDAAGLEAPLVLNLLYMGDCGFSYPTWSPDELKIAYIATCNVTPSAYSDQYIVTVGLASGEAEVLEFGTLPHTLQSLSWSPDGRYFLYSYGYPYSEEDSEIYRLTIDGSELLQLTDNDTQDISPSWAPDGQKIAFTSDRDGDSEIYSMTAQGSGVSKLTNNTINDGMPHWSPDGTKIVYYSGVGLDGDMYTMNANGSGNTEILDMPSGHFPSIDAWQPINVTPFVYRFWSDTNRHHFYTSSFEEAVQVIRDYPDNVWRYEGVAFQAYRPADCVGRKPVYRFWSDVTGGHFYTMNEQEKQQVIDKYDDNVWRYEGVAYCAFEAGGSGRKPVYRFWSNALAGHFYTTNEQEKQQVIDTYSDDVWNYEGIAYYVE